MSIKKFKLKIAKNSPDTCIECSSCTKHCDFLTKHQISLKDFATTPKLADGCNACEQCYNVCPKDISGADIVYDHRYKQNPSGYLVKFQKQNYIFANNSDKKCDDLIYFGCNFPGFYPKTTKHICENLCDKTTDFSIDCCGKPLFMSGVSIEKSLEHTKNLLKSKGIKRLITACPNCYHFLKPRLDIEVVSIYVKLKELNLLGEIKDEAHTFFPCNERNIREIFNDFKDNVPNYKESFLDVNCCGASGGDDDMKKAYPSQIKAKNKPNLYVYCATCGGTFNKNGIKNIRHFTSEFLGVCESPSPNFLTNVLKMKFYKRQR
ncbi:(Fe-S)-binding protein [Campylobacter mucosalis]|uniref:(Fe-S)-binding protein n=1 Tax=Campylobacter mucosalis CCUG 21559 TaxID=1032067 RepID=A0A6G5QEF5_9BACT|nr:(Fe-S)-binding protein [Campylobacter mucosalis]QCD44048.1 hypothetical protein CMUC_0233 [Campylobacter mucosalis CCUG 21559]